MAKSNSSAGLRCLRAFRCAGGNVALSREDGCSAAATRCARRPFAAMGLARASVRFDDMGAEPDGGEEDASQHLARVHFDTVRMTTMCGILDQARWGQLSQGWRSELGAPGRPPATARLQGN